MSILAPNLQEPPNVHRNPQIPLHISLSPIKGLHKYLGCSPLLKSTVFTGWSNFSSLFSLISVEQESQTTGVVQGTYLGERVQAIQ